MKAVYSRVDQRIYVLDDGGAVLVSYEARNEFFPGENEHGEPHESLPIGEYVLTAEEYPAEDNDAFGSGYIDTGDKRGRVFHGGGSGLDAPRAPRQGWYPTLGCIRMQNEDCEDLSRRIIEAGNEVPLTVQEEPLLAA